MCLPVLASSLFPTIRRRLEERTKADLRNIKLVRLVKCF